jgi:hypothetical protein
MVQYDGTNINVTLNSTDGGVLISDRGGTPGILIAITLTSWSIRVKAIQF